MIHRLQNSHISADISLLGAELQSLRSTLNQEEYLWQGNPNIWSGRAPILFPIVGALKDNSTRIGEKVFSIPRHGLVRKSMFSLINGADTVCEYRIVPDSDMRLNYPWLFELRVRFALHESSLEVTYQVSNQDESEMIFTIGSHPAFALADSIDKYDVRFADAEELHRFTLNNAGLLAVNSVPYLNGSTIKLHNSLFDDDALVFKNINSSGISLYHNNQRRLTVAMGGAPHLGVWAKPRAPFVCIEPWFGYSDAQDSSGRIEEKPSMLQLAPGEVFTNRWSISLHLDQ